MSQKAICPRGHIWDPSTLAGLPPTERPRCPICGEEESPRLRSSMLRLGRWLRTNPLLACLWGLCLLLSTSLIVTIFLARSRTQAASEEAEKAHLIAHQFEAKLQSAQRQRENEETQRRTRETEFQELKSSKREKELQAQLREAEKAASDARRQRDEQIHLRKLAEELAQTAEQMRQEAVSRRAETARRLIQIYVASGTRLMESGDLSASLLWLTEALRLAEKEKLATDVHRLRLAHVLAQCPRPVQMWLHDKKLNAVQLSSDGKSVLTADTSGAVEVRDTASGKRIGGLLKHEAIVTNAAFSPNAKRVLTVAADGMLRLWNIEMSEEVFTMECPSPAAGLAFSPDGKRFLIVSKKKPAIGANEVDLPVELHVRNAETGEAVGEIALGSDISEHPALFSPDGQRVLTVCQDRCARVWDIATNKQVGPAFAHAADLVQASFSTDGERVLTASVDGLARVWNTKTGAPVTPFLKHGSAVRGASFGADGRYVLTFGEDRSVRVWDVSKAEATGPALRHAEAVRDAAFSPDGRYVLTTCDDGTARLWDYRTSEEILPALRHGEPIRYAAFGAGGDSVLTLAGRVIRHWDLTSADVGWVERSEAHPAAAELEVFSPDGKRVLRATETTVRVYDTQTNQPVGGTLPHKHKVTAAAFSPDGKRVLTVCHQRNGDELEGHVRVWETATGELLGQPLVHPRSVLEASFNRDGRRIVTACQDGKARLWDVDKNSLLGEPMEHKQDLSRALFLPDGKRLLTVDVEGGLRLWDANTAEAVGPTWGHRKPIHQLAFSRDGQQLVTASEDGTASVWEASTGQEIATTPVQGAPVLQARFSLDGKRIVTASGDRRVRVWEAANGKPVSPPLPHRSAVAFATFSDDGKRIVTVTDDGLRVWEAESGELISPLLRTTGTLTRSTSKEVSLSDAAVRWLRDFRAETRPVTELVRVAEVLSGERLMDAGEIAPLEHDALSKDWQDVHTKYSKEFSPSPQRREVWHQRGVMECESHHLWRGELNHLNYLIKADPSVDLYARRGRANLELKQWEAAKTDYTQALDGDGGRWDLWAGRAEAEAALGRWQDARADYSKAIERKGNRAELWAARGRIEADRGEWPKAAADLGKAIHLGNSDVTVWRQHILALLASGEEANYRRWCGRLLQRFGDSKDEAVFRDVVWTVALSEGTVRDWKPLLERAERSADSRRQLAVLLYLAGQYDAARKRLQEGREKSPSELSAHDGLVMALAALRLGRAEEGKKWLQKAKQIRRERSKDEKETWEDRLIFETLEREAEMLTRTGKD